MGACCSCLETVLENESNVKIHVIEPTTVVMGEPSMIITSNDIGRLPSAHGGRPSSSPLPGSKNVSTTTTTIMLPHQSASASAASIPTATAKPYGGPTKGQLSGGPMILSPYSVGGNGLMRPPQVRTNSARRLAVPQQNANFLHRKHQLIGKRPTASGRLPVFESKI